MVGFSTIANKIIIHLSNIAGIVSHTIQDNKAFPKYLMTVRKATDNLSDNRYLIVFNYLMCHGRSPFYF